MAIVMTITSEKSLSNIFTRTQLILSIALILLAFAVRLHNLADDSLWSDEILTTEVADRGWVAFEGRRDHPGLYFLITAGFYETFGDTEFSVRLSSLIWGILAIPLMILAGRTLGRTSIGLWAALLLALSPFHLRYSQEARMYAQLMTFSLLSFIFLYWVLKRPGWKNWLLFTFATILNLYTHYGALLVLVSQSFLIAIWALDHLIKGQRKQLLWLIYSALLVILLYLPMIPRFFESLPFNVGAQTQTGTGAWVPFIIWIENAIRDFGMFDPGRAILLLSICTLGLVLLAFDKKWFDLSWILTGLLFPLGLIYIFQVARGAYSRYIIYLLPFYLLPVAYALDRALITLNRRIKNSAYGWGSTALALAFFWLSWPSIGQEYQYINEDWRGIASYLNENAGDGDVILATTMNMSFNVVGKALPVYLNGAGNSYQLVRGNFVDLEQAVALKGSESDVWAGVSHWAEPTKFADPSLAVIDFQTNLHVIHDIDGQGSALEKVIALYEQLMNFATSPLPRCLQQSDLGTLYFANGNYQGTAQMIADAAEICPDKNVSARGFLAGYLDEARLVEELDAIAANGDVVIGLGTTISDTKQLEASALPYLIQEAKHTLSYIRGEKLEIDKLGAIGRREGDVWYVVWDLDGSDPRIQAGFQQFNFGDGLYLLRDQQASGTILDKMVNGKERLASKEIQPTTLCMLDQQIVFSYAALRQIDRFFDELDQLVADCLNDLPDEAFLSLIGQEIHLGLRLLLTELLVEDDLANAGEVTRRLVTFEHTHPDAPELPTFSQSLADGDIENARLLAYETIEIDHKNPDALALLTFKNLLKQFERGDVQVDDKNLPEPVEVRRFVMPRDGQWGNVLFTHPPISVPFAIKLPQEPVDLKTRVALDPQSWGWGGDGVTFIVTIQQNGREPVELYRNHISNDESGHEWQELLVSLAPYAGKQVLITLSTDQGPQGDGTGDWAGWDSPRLLWQP
jgi:hypothetical protein